jgi:galactokinase
MRLFVPGRLCLFGEHSDWAGGYRRSHPEIEPGYTVICGTSQGIHARVQAHPGSLVLTSTETPGAEPFILPMLPGILLEEARRGGFWSYVAGVAWRALSSYPVQGLRIANDRTDLPVGKGLSSSAAVCVLTARAFNRVYDLGLTVREEMELAYQGEIATPSRCGRMDQGCAFGRIPVLMTFDGDRMETRELRPGGRFFLAIVDLGSRKSTRRILARLNDCFPATGGETARGVRDLLGPVNRRIVREAVEALQTGDGERLGGLMIEAQDAFDRLAGPACPEELTAPLLHRVLRHRALQAHLWGGKGVGSQGDGTAQLLARSEPDRDQAVEILRRELGMSCLPLNLG